MKFTFTIICLGLFLSLSAQEAKTERETKNQEKINSLNERLDKLMENQDVGGDSINYKIDLLFKEIRGIKKDLQELQGSVEELKEEEEAEIAESTTNSIINAENYYVVIASRRDIGRAKRAMAGFGASRDLLMVRNVQDSWYHLIINKSYQMEEAIKMVDVERNSGIADSWWVTGKKLKLIDQTSDL